MATVPDNIKQLQKDCGTGVAIFHRMDWIRFLLLISLSASFAPGFEREAQARTWFNNSSKLSKPPQRKTIQAAVVVAKEPAPAPKVAEEPSLGEIPLEKMLEEFDKQSESNYLDAFPAAFSSQPGTVAVPRAPEPSFQKTSSGRAEQDKLSIVSPSAPDVNRVGLDGSSIQEKSERVEKATPKLKELHEDILKAHKNKKLRAKKNRAKRRAL